MSDLSAKKYDFPVYATQGGGLARSVGDKTIFITKPNCPGLDVGDEVPEEWDLIPVNDLAKEEMEEARYDYEHGRHCTSDAEFLM